MKPIYLDYNATTPIASEVIEAMLPYLYEHFGNPSSSHPYGRDAKAAVDLARQRLAGLINVDPQDIIFTSSGTESNNMALIGVARAYSDKGKHLITSAVEHPAVMEVCLWLKSQGWELTILDVDDSGKVNPADLEKAITPKTFLVSIMLANNEVGTRQPIEELVHITHAHGALFHTDAAQAVGKIPLNASRLGVDLLSIAGHKLYAPKGVGALYLRSGVHLDKLMLGANHEFNRRPGTENVLEIVGLGKAAEVALRDMQKNQVHYQKMRDSLLSGLREHFDETRMRVNGCLSDGLPNTLSVSFKGIDVSLLLDRISGQVCASAGAACHADQVSVSSVLTAMRVPNIWAIGTVRFSVGRETDLTQIHQAVQVIAQMVDKLQIV